MLIHIARISCREQSNKKTSHDMPKEVRQVAHLPCKWPEEASFPGALSLTKEAWAEWKRPWKKSPCQCDKSAETSWEWQDVHQQAKR